MAFNISAQKKTDCSNEVEIDKLTSLSIDIPNVKGDGVHDDTDGIQTLLDSKKRTIYLPVPPMFYKITKTLKIHSGQTLILDRNAMIRLNDSACVHMITNSDHVSGNSMITIIGGIWDGNNLTQKQEYHETGNCRLPFDPERYLGVIMQFNKVTDLHVANLTLKDPETYGFQAGNLLRFTIENIVFDYNLKRGNMDGIHIHGNSHQGRIVNLKGATNDDLVALNADDVSMFELSSGPITDILVDGVWSDDGYRAVRLLSCNSLVKNINITNVFGTYKQEAVSLTNHKAHSKCESQFENITISNMYCSNSAKGSKKSQIRIESPARISNLVIDNCHRTEMECASDNILIEKGVNINYLLFTKSTLFNRTETPIHFIKNLGNIEVLHLSNIYMKGEHTQSTVQLLNNEGSIESFEKQNISIKNPNFK